MMRVSPCAWYCFELGEEGGWRVEERGDHTLFLAPDGTCAIEIAAARREGAADEDAIAGIHERYLKDESIQPVKTALTENPHRIAAYVTRGLGMDEREHIVCHAWWSNYCAFIKYRGRRGPETAGRIRAFYDVVDSLQPLIEK